MPWIETNAVNERARFVVLYGEQDPPNLSLLCRQFGVSRPTGYKWLERFGVWGFESLSDKPRVPSSIPHRTALQVEDAIVALRKQRPTWGPKKLLAVLSEQQKEIAWPSQSTIGEILSRRGLIRPKRRRLRTVYSGGELEGARGPNDVWAIDFKGHFALGNQRRCHPLTVTDLYSRYLLKCEGMERETFESAQPALELAFREFGLPNRLRSDNGSPFASLSVGGLCPLAIWLIQVGVTPERIRPSSPQENGSHERMHKTLKAEATRPARQDLASQQRAFDEFRALFNRDRPHEALGQKPPASVYVPSERPFPAELKHPEYPTGYVVRKTNINGVFCFKQTRFFVSKKLLHAPIGIQAIDDDHWRVFYGPLSLGYIDGQSNPLKYTTTARRLDRIAPSLAALASAERPSTNHPVPVNLSPESVNHVPG